MGGKKEDRIEFLKLKWGSHFAFLNLSEFWGKNLLFEKDKKDKYEINLTMEGGNTKNVFTWKTLWASTSVVY